MNSNLIEIIIDRLPNIFGKWSKPNYNSVVATYCYNISRNKNIIIENPRSKLELVYIDDLIIRFLRVLKNFNSKKNLLILKKNTFPIYKISVKELANKIKEIKKSRKLIFCMTKILNLIKNFMQHTSVTYLPVILNIS